MTKGYPSWYPSKRVDDELRVQANECYSASTALWTEEIKERSLYSPRVERSRV